MKFDIELLSQGKMVTTGSSVLKMMQNKSTQKLDLIVRESIQNSLDASIKGFDTVDVYFDHGKFNVKNFANKFARIEDSIKRKFNKTESEYLAIKDCNTCGLLGALDGEFDSGEKNQNLGKLVFHIMKAQDQEGAGGSWGIGKTVYYRLGTGLVIYYSRIKQDDGTFQERLVAALVENEMNVNGYLYSLTTNKNAGIAFFGEKKKDDPTKIQAITNSYSIKEFLDVFGIEPFKNSETGTQIIIPFIEEDNLISDCSDAGDADSINEFKKWWNVSIEDYLENAIFRWYFPRMCKNYPYGARLRAFINGEQVAVAKQTKIFEKFQELYDAAYSNENIPDWINKKEIRRKTHIRDGLIGTFTFGKVSKSEFKGGWPSPYEYTLTTQDNENYNQPIVSFSRQPGMVINYNSELSSVRCDKDEYIIGVFTLNSKTTLTVKDISINLDEYIRESEKSDHMAWSDYQVNENVIKVLIVKNINDGVKNALTNLYNPKPVSNGSTVMDRGLALKFGKLLMPNERFGNSVSGIIRKPPREGKKKNNDPKDQYKKKKKLKTVVNVGKCKYVNGKAIVCVEFSITENNKFCKIESLINTIQGPIYPDEWNSLVGDSLLNMESAVVKCLYYDGKETSSMPSFIKMGEEQTYNGYNVIFSKTSDNKIYGIGFEKTKEAKDAVFQVNIQLSSTDKHVQTIFEPVVEDE